MSRTRRAIVFSLAIAISMGCRTRPLPEPVLIELPDQMTRQQAQVAIIAGIINKPPPPEYDPNKELSEAEFNAVLWRRFIADASRRSWFPEARSADTIYASVDTRGLYLRAAIEIHANHIRISIVESRNLHQSETRIHRRAIQWIRNLEAHIRREVGRMSVIIGPAG